MGDRIVEIPFGHPHDADHVYSVTPDEVDALVADLAERDPPELALCPFHQHGGRTAHAITLTDPAVPMDRKRRLFVSRPHAHEPAGVAACTEMVKALLGIGVFGGGYEAWRADTLRAFAITFVPDANPSGSQRAPVKFWDGTQIPNEQFFLWMFGESGEEPGQRFPRLDAWDMRTVVRPALLGIAYEQIDAHMFVEPNRDYRSTFFGSYFELDRTYGYDVWLDLHQTEFLNSDWNAEVHLRTCHDDLDGKLRERHEDLGGAIHDAWLAAGARPRSEPVVPYRGNATQREFLSKVWRPISERMVHIVTEVQNNNTRTPVPEQVHLQIVAVLATLGWMSAN